MFGLSPAEMLIVGVVAILLFGSRLPSVARSMGKSLTEFRRGMQDLQHEFRGAMHEADAAAREPARPTPAAGAQSRLPAPAAVAHEVPRDDGASDSVYDTRRPEPEALADDDTPADRREGATAG